MKRTRWILVLLLSAVLLRGLCLSTLSRRCQTLSTLSLGTAQTILRMQRLQTRR